MHYNVLLAGSVPWLAFHFFCYSNKLRQRLGVWASRPHLAFVVILKAVFRWVVRKVRAGRQHSQSLLLNIQVESTRIINNKYTCQPVL